MKNSLFLFIICTCMVSCMDFPSKVENYVLSQYGYGDSVFIYTIDMQDVLGVDISNVYVFSEITSSEEISEIIGIELPHKEITWSWDTKYRIICIQDKRITYEELYEMKNICFVGNDTTWHLSKDCQDLYSHYYPGMTSPTLCAYQVFRSSRMNVKRKVLSNRERKACRPISRYWYELSAAK